MISYKISDDFETLTLTVAEGAELDPDDDETEIVEHLINNSSLSWLAEGVVGGDLTSAPMLAILGPTEAGEGGFGKNAVDAGFWDGKAWCNRVLARWGWMSYAVTSLADQLRDKRVAVLHGGLVNCKFSDVDVADPRVVEHLPDMLAFLDQPELELRHDLLSDLVEDPHADPEVLRQAAASLLVFLNDQHEFRHNLLKRIITL